MANGQLGTWKERADGIWSDPVFRHRDAARLLLDIAERGGAETLAGAARQALPSLKQAAAAAKADPDRLMVARRRFGRVREQLHVLTKPSFGHRALETRPLVCASVDCAAERRLLGLPLQGPVTGPEIATAFKRAAKAAHPDQGGDAGRFAEIVRARDVLLGKG